MLSDALEKLRFPSFHHLAIELIHGEVHDVVVVQLFRRHQFTKIQPVPVNERDFV